MNLYRLNIPKIFKDIINFDENQINIIGFVIQKNSKSNLWKPNGITYIKERFFKKEKYCFFQKKI